MTAEIKQRIEQIQRGEVPEGYRRTKDIGMAPKEWRIGKLSDVLHNEQRPVPKPDKPYWRLGVKSWAKGTFHAYVDDPSTVDMGELYVVKEKDLVVNITFAWEHAIALAKKEDEGLLVSHRFPTYMFDDGNVPEFYQAVFGQPFFKDLLDNISPGGAGRNRVLNRKDFLNLPCYIPPIEEQRKISDILATCDRVIELKQKLVDELKKLKRVCLEKMFPQEGETVPEIRFSRFTGPWKQRKLKDAASSFEYGLNAAAKEYDGTNKYIRITDIDDESRVFKDDDLTSPDTNLSTAENYRLDEGDLLFARTGASVGKTYIYRKSDGLVYFAGFLIRVKIKPEYSAEFVFQNTLTPQYEKYVLITSQRSGQPGVNAQEYGKYLLLTPDYSEQEKIGNFLHEIDNLIALRQRELEEEQKKKKALMQLLLTGIVRVNR